MVNGHVLYYGGKNRLFYCRSGICSRVIFIWGNFTSYFFQSNDKWVYAFKRNIFIFKFYILLLFYIKIFFFLQQNMTCIFTDTQNNLFSVSILLHYKFQSMMNNSSFISSSVKELQAISKRIKIFEYLKNYVTSNGFIFLQETHSSVKDEKLWNDEFEGQLFFSHGKTNSCGVAIGFVGTKALNILNITRDNLGRILVIEVKIDDSVFVLINIYNANTESEQLHTLNDLVNILETIEDIQNKSVVLGGDFNVILNPSLDSEGG